VTSAEILERLRAVVRRVDEARRAPGRAAPGTAAEAQTPHARHRHPALADPAAWTMTKLWDWQPPRPVVCPVCRGHYEVRDLKCPKCGAPLE